MLTTTHVALAGGLGRALARAGVAPRHRLPVVPLAVGGLLPDLGLLTAMAGAAVAAALDRRSPLDGAAELLATGISSSVLELAHVALHAPLVGAGLLLLGIVLPSRTGTVVRACAVGLLLHIALDIVTHVQDGPLLLFPFDRTTAFSSPVSWHDPAHWGWLVLPVDIAISVGLGGWLLASGEDTRRSSSQP